MRDAWLVHAVKARGEDADGNGIDVIWEASGQSWWLSEMNTAVDGSTVSYQTQDSIPDYFLQLNHDLDLTLQ